MHDYSLVIDGADTRPEDERNKSGRGRLASGTVTAPTAAHAMRQAADAVERMAKNSPDPDGLLENIVRVQLKRAD